MPPRDVPCVGAIVIDGAGRFLLIRRGNPPAQGQWSLPGGRVELGETHEEAVLRELREETDVVGTLGRHVGEVRRDAPDGSVYVIQDYLVLVDGSAIPRAGDDALDAAWFSVDQLSDLDTSPGLTEALTEWGIIPE